MMAQEPARGNPRLGKEGTIKRGGGEEFIWLLEQCRLGRLWLQVDYAPLAGQSPRLWEEALYLKRRGLNVVLAQPLGPAQGGPAALADLPVAPARRVEYLGVTLEELDLARVLAMHPQVAVVTDLGHVNPPGSRHPQRWQEVQVLLASGVSVLASANLADLEGALQPGLAQPEPDPRRSVPESFWRAADQLEAADIPVSAALEILAASLGRNGSGRPSLDADQLERLRQCALELTSGKADPGADKDALSPSGGRVMVCLASLSPRGRALVERGRELAQRLGTSWFVVHASPPGEELPSPHSSLMGLAASQGAELAQITGRDPVAALMDFARAHGVGHIILGRSLRPWWRQVFGRSPMLRLVQEAAGFDLHIVETADAESRP